MHGFGAMSPRRRASYTRLCARFFSAFRFFHRCTAAPCGSGISDFPFVCFDEATHDGMMMPLPGCTILPRVCCSLKWSITPFCANPTMN